MEVIKGPDSHNHTPDPASIEKRQVVKKVIALAAASTETTASVVATALEGTSVACLGKAKAKVGLTFPLTFLSNFHHFLYCCCDPDEQQSTFTTFSFFH